MWPIFHGLNDWRIVQVKPATKGDQGEDLHAAQDVVLKGLVKAMIVGGKRNPEENVTNSETNENPRKKTFSRDTTKEG
jgi:hypothetical protein